MGGREGVLLAQCCASAVGFAAFGDMFVLLIWVERRVLFPHFFSSFFAGSVEQHFRATQPKKPCNVFAPGLVGENMACQIRNYCLLRITHTCSYLLIMACEVKR